MSLYKTKVDKVKSLLAAGAFQKALAIVKTFRIGLSKKEKRIIEIASECFTGNEDFYRSLGINTEKEIEQAVSLLKEKFQ